MLEVYKTPDRFVLFFSADDWAFLALLFRRGVDPIFYAPRSIDEQQHLKNEQTWFLNIELKYYFRATQNSCVTFFLFLILLCECKISFKTLVCSAVNGNRRLYGSTSSRLVHYCCIMSKFCLNAPLNWKYIVKLLSYVLTGGIPIQYISLNLRKKLKIVIFYNSLTTCLTGVTCLFVYKYMK